MKQFIVFIFYFLFTTFLFSQPFSSDQTLFDQSNEATLGLVEAAGTETFTIYSSAPGNDHYANGVVMTAFKGKLYCQWQSSAVDEDAPDTWVAYSISDDGTNWSEPLELAPSINNGHCTSGGWWVNGDTLIAYINIWYDATSPRGGFTYYMTSTDGLTWSTMLPLKMADGSSLNGIFEQDPHTLPNGRIINAAHLQPGIKAHPIYTDDPSGIRGWKLGEYTNLAHAGDVSREIEPSWFSQADGDAIMVFRDQNSSYVKWASRSQDQGQTWSTAVPTDMPDSRSKQSAGNLPDGTAYLVGCPKSNKFRWPLAIATSPDGEHFDKAYLLRSEHNLPAQKYDGLYKTLGYSYPKSMVYNRYLYVAYSTNKEDVEFTRIPLSSINRNCTNGSIDKCGICSGGNSGVTPCISYLEAEQLCTLEGTIDDNNIGFSGIGFVNTTNVDGASVSWAISSTSTISTSIQFKYAHGGTNNRDGMLSVNGIEQGTVLFPSTESWTNWEKTTTNIVLSTGVNEIKLSALTPEGLANIDAIFSPEEIEHATCDLITTVQQGKGIEVKVYPNPVHHLLYLSNKMAWEIESINGSKIMRGESDSIDTETLSNGIYFLKTGQQIVKFIKE